MNAFSCSAGACWLVDIALVCSFSDPDFTLHISLLMADMNRSWIRRSWRCSRKPLGLGLEGARACDHAGTDDVRTSGAADRMLRARHQRLALYFSLPSLPQLNSVGNSTDMVSAVVEHIIQIGELEHDQRVPR